MDLDSRVLAEADLPVFAFLLTQPTSFSLSSLFTLPLASLPLFFAKTALGCQPPAPPGQWWDSQGLCHVGLSRCGTWRWSWLPLSYEPSRLPKDGHHWSPEEDSDELTQTFGVLHSKRESHARWCWGMAQGRGWKGRVSWNWGIAKDDQLSGILCSSAQLLETGVLIIIISEQQISSELKLTSQGEGQGRNLQVYIVFRASRSCFWQDRRQKIVILFCKLFSKKSGRVLIRPIKTLCSGSLRFWQSL